MKRFSFKMKKKNLIWLLASLLVLLLLWGLNSIRLGIVSSIDSQNMVDRWGSKRFGQVSLFTAEGTGLSEENVLFFEHDLDSKLQEESIEVQSDNESARLWVDAYSSQTQLTFTREKKSSTCNVFGVGGDFFLLHPMEFVSGGGFGSQDLNTDYCVLDEDVAWQLFGATDVSGMYIDLNGRPLVVRGVVKRETGRFAEAAGLDKPIAFISYRAMSQATGEAGLINHYEILMPNPVSGYALDKLKTLYSLGEEQTVYVDNTERYDFLSTVFSLVDFGVRNMSKMAIAYPYWENIARAYEEVNRLLVLLEIPLIVYLIGFLLGVIIHWYRHKKWTARSAWEAINNKAYDLSARRKQRRLAKKNK